MHGMYAYGWQRMACWPNQHMEISFDWHHHFASPKNNLTIALVSSKRPSYRSNNMDISRSLFLT